VGESRALFCRFVNWDFYCFNQQYMNHDQYSFIGTFSFQIDCLERTDETPNHQFAIRIKPTFPFVHILVVHCFPWTLSFLFGFSLRSHFPVYDSSMDPFSPFLSSLFAHFVLFCSSWTQHDSFVICNTCLACFLMMGANFTTFISSRAL
jgi:hypothetical protein